MVRVSKLTSRLSEEATRVVELFSKLISQTCHEHHINMGLHTSSKGNYRDDRSIEDIRMDLITFFSGLRERVARSTLQDSSPAYISNLNTFSALMDRLVIENIKLYQLREGVLVGYDSQLQERISVLKYLLRLLERELVRVLTEIFICGEYIYAEESRTYKKM